MSPVLCIIQKPAQTDETAVADDRGPEQSAAGPRDARGGRARKRQLAQRERALSESGGPAPPARLKWTVTTVARCVLEWVVLVLIVVLLKKTWVGSSPTDVRCVPHLPHVPGRSRSTYHLDRLGPTYMSPL